MVRVAFSSVYKYELPEGHRFPMEKYDLLPEQLIYEGTLEEEQFFEPQRLTDGEILSTHTEEYLEKLRHHTYTRKEARKIGFPISDALVERGRRIASGTYEAVEYAKMGGVALNIAGGTHHAFPGHGEGFCVFNDIAIASNLLLDRKEAKKILIIDLDVHQGNGNARIFQNDDRVFTFSMHGAKNYPLRKERSDLDIGLKDGTRDALYLGVLKDILPRLIDHVRPDVVFYQSGVDVLEVDKLGRLNLSKEGLSARDWHVLDINASHGIPVVVTMGGGYAPKISDIIDAHAHVFRLAQSMHA